MKLFAELRRRNVLRAAVLYIGAVWALAQGIAQLGPVLGAPDSATRWFLVAAAIGFPFWLAASWFYELTPEGLKRESELAPDDAAARGTGRKLDFLIIGVLAVAVVLLLADRFVPRVPAPSDRSIAVLPLANEGGDPRDQYFSDGLSEDLITALSQFPGLKVIARDSAFRFRDSKEGPAAIAKQLGVTHLLEGSVRRLGDTVRISATLVKAGDGSTAWSQHYDRPYKDLFALQDEITRAVSGALQARLLDGTAMVQGDRPASGNIAAYEAVLQGNFLLDRRNDADVRKAMASFRRAVALDPGYAYAWAQLAYAEVDLLAYFPPASQEERDAIAADARAASATALRLAPELAVAHRTRAWLLDIVERDPASALPESERAVALAPQDVQAVIDLGRAQSMMGRMDQSIATYRHAIALDPLSSRARYHQALVQLSVGRNVEAEAGLHQAIDLQPKASAYRACLAIAQMQQGRAGAAVATAGEEPDPFWRTWALAMVQWANGDRAASDAALQSLIATNADDGGSQIAAIYAQRRQPEEMMRWLEHARAVGDSGILEVLISPFLRVYKDDPRFIAFAREVGVLPAQGTEP